MQALMLGPEDTRVQVQEEPALEIALPQVFAQPPLTTLQRGKLPHVEQLVARISRHATERQGTGTLGQEYQELVNEFQPLFSWSMACWDFLLSTEGCRFVLRQGDEKLYCRGDYRAVTDKEYSRLVHRVFRQCVLTFAQHPLESSLAGFLRTYFWEAVFHAYRALNTPPDPRQRPLSPYSYLRCVPYRFLNDFHQDVVSRRLRQLPSAARQAMDGYFLQFWTLPATCQAMNLPLEPVEELLRRSLLDLLLKNRLVYCLLRQIERY